MALPPILIFLAILALVLYVSIGYFWANRTNPPTLLLVTAITVLVILLWVFRIGA